MIGGVDIFSIFVGTATRSLFLDGCFVTAMNMGATGDWIPIVNTLGSEDLCGTLAAVKALQAGFTYSITGGADATNIGRQLQQMGNNGTREKHHLEILMQDQDSNLIRLATYGETKTNVPASFGGTSDGPVSGTFAQGTHEKTSTSGGIIWQTWALGGLET